jgi:16S rRNA (guanine527-N7)-methyltransferase
VPVGIPVELEDEPAVASTLFGSTADTARSFVRHLAERGDELGLIGPLELPRLWSRHVVNSALLAPLLTTGARVGDVGSGAGLPGLVLAIARPDVRLVLIEPMERRTDWLESEADALGLTNVEVLRLRAEDVPRTIALDQVTARAVSALGKLLPLVAPLLRPGGEMLLMKGASVEVEMEKARSVISRLKLRRPEVLVLGEGLDVDPTRVFRAAIG